MCTWKWSRTDYSSEIYFQSYRHITTKIVSLTSLKLPIHISTRGCGRILEVSWPFNIDLCAVLRSSF